jgi:DNA-binding NtrC family response regulator
MTTSPGEPVGEIALMMELCRDLSWVARSGATVLVTGESDVATKWVARTIHTHSARASRPFVTVDCGLPGTRLESELFGDPRNGSGSPSGGVSRLALADSGTIFLAGIGAMPAAVQQRLFRFLQTGELETSGTGRAAQRVDVRVVAATSRDLQELIAGGTFDEDLYYRLNVIHLHVPPLSERSGDIGGLVEQLLARQDLDIAGRVERAER